MPSIVLHIRLDAESIYVAQQAVANNGIKVEGMPLSTMMRHYIEGTTLHYMSVAQVVIPQNAEELLLQTENQPIKPIDITMPMGHTSPEEARKDLIKKALGAVVSPGIKTDDPDFNENQTEEDKELPPAPWIGLTSFETLKAISPKDMILEQVPDDDEITKHCVEVVYDQLPSTEWGTPAALRRIKEVSPLIERYF